MNIPHLRPFFNVHLEGSDSYPALNGSYLQAAYCLDDKRSFQPSIGII